MSRQEGVRRPEGLKRVLGHHIDQDSSEFQKALEPKFSFLGGIGKAKREKKLIIRVRAHNHAHDHEDRANANKEKSEKKNEGKILSKDDKFWEDTLDNEVRLAGEEIKDTAKALPKSLRGDHK